MHERHVNMLSVTHGREHTETHKTDTQMILRRRRPKASSGCACEDGQDVNKVSHRVESLQHEQS